jgi:queuine tRNA-ribosyltransferase
VFRAQEMISGMLLTWHNLTYFQDIMQGMREAISAGQFAQWEAAFHATRAEGDIAPL